MNMDHTKQLELALQEVGRQAIRISQLEQELSCLKNGELAGLNASQADPAPSKKRKFRRDSVDQESIKLSASTYELELRRRCEALELENAQLSTALDKRTKLFEQVQQQYKKAKHYCQQWKEYYEAHRLGSHTDRDDTARTSSDTRTAVPSVASHSRLHVNRSLPSVQSPPTDANIESNRRLKLEAPPSSQATESEPDEATPTKAADDDYVPVVVAARPVRRRRDATERRTSPKAVKIKLEPTSPHRPIALTSTDDHGRETFDVPAVEPDTSDLDIDHPATRIRRQARSRPESTRCASEKHESLRPKLYALSSSLSNSAENSTDVTSISRMQHDIHSVLQPISNNLPTSSRVRSRRATHLDCEQLQNRKIADLAEDGDLADDGFMKTPTTTGKGVAPVKDQRRNRLAALLAHPQADSSSTSTSEGSGRTTRQLLTPVSTASNRPAIKVKSLSGHGVSKVTRKQLETPRTERPGSAPSNAWQTPQLHHRDDNRSAQDAPGQTDPLETPLRTRPLGTLRLDDFTINPAYADSGFAFTDPIRGRDARRCLPGCTRSECCGEVFQRAIALGGMADMSGRDTNEDNEDAVFLEEHLGPTWASVMAGLSDVRQTEMIAQARGRAFAKRFGRHREVFARRRTPPGFWRTDMPSTQEQADDRARASQMERDQVQERWLEALRPNGRWSFRDEASPSIASR